MTFGNIWRYGMQLKVKQYTFEGHEAAVYSVCPHQKENIQRDLELIMMPQVIVAQWHIVRMVQVWDMDNTNIQPTLDVEGSLPSIVAQLSVNAAPNTTTSSGAATTDRSSVVIVAGIVQFLFLGCHPTPFIYFWKWPHNEKNSSGKATTNIPPQLWQPTSGILMTNDTTDASQEEAIPALLYQK
ncbi:hypothetical protein HPP92_000471 [Vanilla planifolia]|uniref:Uncharacterized protein n=1 Tax=Vanilla planifolia TaxID=51239 RepID=A0A835RWH4_VANPL|nr:hypothetical protein HPP92_000471 [Vanilla planifolia]